MAEDSIGAAGRDCLALAHGLDHLDHDSVDLLGQRHLLAVRAEQQGWLGVVLKEPAQVQQGVRSLGGKTTPVAA